MFQSMRKIFGPVAVTAIIGAIAMVFVFYGVYSPKGTKGLGSEATAATVNGDSISMQEYSREYQQRVDFYANMMKGKVDPNLLKQLGLRQQVIEDMIRRHLMLQEAERMGMTVSDDELRDKIQEMQYFKKDGHFDASLYQKVLEANRQSPATFEEMMRQDLMRNQLVSFMRGQARVSEKELQDEFQNSEDRRQVDYILLDRSVAKKRMVVSEKEVEAFLKEPRNTETAKAYYEQNKMNFVKKEKPKPEYFSFEEVKSKVATDMLKDRHSEEVAKINHDLGKELMDKAKSAPASLASFAKSKGLDVKSSAKFNRVEQNIPGLGELAELQEDAFKDMSPLSAGPKMYENGGRVVIAMNLKSFKPDAANFSKERDKLVQSAAQRKEQLMYEQWMGDLRQKAKVSLNKAIQQDEVATAED